MVSETAPERAPAPGGGGSRFGLFAEKIGPLPMWGWVGIIAAGIIAWRLYSSRKNAASSSTSTSADGTSASDVPQFVNQTYVTTTPPVQGPPTVQTGVIESFGPVPKQPKPPGPQQLTRTWTSQGGSTYAQVAQRLLGNPDVANLHPANAAAQKWVNGPYKRNHNAKMPRGLEFTYTEGTITPKGASVPTVK